MVKENCKTFVTIARRLVTRLNKDCTKKDAKFEELNKKLYA